MNLSTFNELTKLKNLSLTKSESSCLRRKLRISISNSFGQKKFLPSKDWSSVLYRLFN